MFILRETMKLELELGIVSMKILSSSPPCIDLGGILRTVPLFSSWPLQRLA
jgi:hypothetical protein